MKAVFIELPAFERDAGLQFWLFTLYGKDEMSDLTSQQRRALKQMLKVEIEARRK